MAYLPGTDDAIYPGEITVDLVVEDDQANIVFDLRALLGPLDGLLPQLARTLTDLGLMDEFRALGTNVANDRRRLAALDALQAQPRVGQVFQITRTIGQAQHLADVINALAVEPEPCTWPGCVNYRLEGEHCPAHDADPADDTDVAWDVAG